MVLSMDSRLQYVMAVIITMAQKYVWFSCGPIRIFQHPS